ncbi:hypothetical protein JMJ56_24520 [Belnapia sp. T18]|uniref:Uncharacterized protein n=1 Tax=Belnapia arida TaxID=2804533 RepID=A0ABS1U917_9PROT|nr:hypothetical protein [Belnapia arida]MBL6081169.1 hypothetical protein [Belnapia arida]
MAAPEGRHLAARGRAQALKHGLRCKDFNSGRAWAERIGASAGPIAGLKPDDAARRALRVLAEVTREDARRELGEYDDGLETAFKAANGILAAAATIPVSPALAVAGHSTSAGGVPGINSAVPAGPPSSGSGQAAATLH